MRAAVPMSYCRAKPAKNKPNAMNITPDQKSLAFLIFMLLPRARVLVDACARKLHDLLVLSHFGTDELLEVARGHRRRFRAHPGESFAHLGRPQRGRELLVQPL